MGFTLSRSSRRFGRRAAACLFGVLVSLAVLFCVCLFCFFASAYPSPTWTYNDSSDVMRWWRGPFFSCSSSSSFFFVHPLRLS
jgi:hypothetical protein